MHPIHTDGHSPDPEYPPGFPNKYQTGHFCLILCCKIR
jgi:hypothetical protein